jgi:hypothetical protein
MGFFAKKFACRYYTNIPVVWSSLDHSKDDSEGGSGSNFSNQAVEVVGSFAVWCFLFFILHLIHGVTLAQWHDFRRLHRGSIGVFFPEERIAWSGDLFERVSYGRQQQALKIWACFWFFAQLCLDIRDACL